jgi:chromosome segregation ATPase
MLHPYVVDSLRASHEYATKEATTAAERVARITAELDEARESLADYEGRRDALAAELRRHQDELARPGA